MPGQSLGTHASSLTRRLLLQTTAAAAVSYLLGGRVPCADALATPASGKAAGVDPELARDWLGRWRKNILADARNRYCDRESGEELGWLVSPFVNAFYYGYLATGDTAWLDLLVDWSDAWIKRGVKEPDGHIGWPKMGAASTSAVQDLFTDSMLGEAMALRPVAQMASLVAKTPALKDKYGEKARQYLDLSEQTFAKWDARGCWRDVGEGGVWVVPQFGIDREKNTWTAGYDRRATDGFTLPDNKQNLVAQWVVALHDATGKPVYRERAEKWWKTMKSRLRLRDGKYNVWDYWAPAGTWDYKPDGSTRHWVGVHPNGGYYGIDVEGIVSAYEHGLVFDRADIDRLVATNRDFMWDQTVAGAKFGRIDGGKPEGQWKDSPGVLWDALVPYDATLRKIFEANLKPDSWGGMAATPWYLSLKG